VPEAKINVRIVQAKAEANGGRKTYLSLKEVPESFAPKQHLNFVFHLNLRTELIEVKGTRILLRKARLGETPQAQAEEAPRPPAESECLERKSTPKLYKPIKNLRNTRFSLSLSKVWHLPIWQMFFSCRKWL
jgi:hypothetical protein